jgi:hypothetical protein
VMMVKLLSCTAERPGRTAGPRDFHYPVFLCGSCACR